MLSARARRMPQSSKTCIWETGLRSDPNRRSDSTSVYGATPAMLLLALPPPTLVPLVEEVSVLDPAVDPTAAAAAPASWYTCNAPSLDPTSNLQPHTARPSTRKEVFSRAGSRVKAGKAGFDVLPRSFDVREGLDDVPNILSPQSSAYVMISSSRHKIILSILSPSSNMKCFKLSRMTRILRGFATRANPSDRVRFTTSATTATPTSRTRAFLPFCDLRALERLAPTESIRFEFGKDRHGFPREAFVFVLEEGDSGGELFAQTPNAGGLSASEPVLSTPE